MVSQEIPNLKIQMQSYRLDVQKQVYVYENAVLEWADIRLEAGEVTLDAKNRTITADQFVRYSDSRIIAIVDRLVIDVSTQKGVFYNVALFDASTQAFIQAKEIRKIDNLHYVAKECSLTTCDPESPSWQIKGDEVNYQGDNFSSAEGAVLEIADIPIFYFPVLFWPTVSKRQTGFLAPSFEIQSSSEPKFDLGGKFKIPYYWAMADDQNLTFEIDMIEKRGVGVGFEYEYAYQEGMLGKLRFWQIRERDKRDPSVESGSLKEDDIEKANLRPLRFKLEVEHNQTLGERGRFLLSGQIFSDSQFQREYERVLDPNPNYAQHINTSLSYQFESGDAGILIDRELVFEEVAVLNQNFNETRVQRLPEFSFNYSQTPWEIPLTFELEGVATRFHRDKGLIGWREIGIPRLHYNQSFFSLFNLTLSLGKRFSAYQVHNTSITVEYEDGTTAFKPQEEREFSYGIELIDAEVNTSFSRVWESDFTPFSRFKHLMTPRILFSSVQDVNQDLSRKVVFPTNPELNIEAEPEPVDFFDGEDSIPGKRLLTLRLDNLLLAKRYVSERRVVLTESSLSFLRDRLNDSVLAQLRSLLGQEFASESKFLRTLNTLLGNSITLEQEDLILSSAQKGPQKRVTINREDRSESPSWVLSRLNLIQRYNYLLRDKNFNPKGPELTDQESEQTKPLLPLMIEWVLNPGPRFSVDFFLRYDYQANRVVESKAGFNVELTSRNQAEVQFHNNETAYRTPENVFHEKTNTLQFSNIFEATDNLSFGYSGKLNLSVAEEQVLKRRLIEDSFFVNYHPRCYVIRLAVKEIAEKTVTQGGIEKEIVDPFISLTISLGEVLPLPEQEFHF